MDLSEKPIDLKDPFGVWGASASARLVLQHLLVLKGCVLLGQPAVAPGVFNLVVAMLGAEGLLHLRRDPCRKGVKRHGCEEARG